MSTTIRFLNKNLQINLYFSKFTIYKKSQPISGQDTLLLNTQYLRTLNTIYNDF